MTEELPKKTDSPIQSKKYHAAILIGATLVLIVGGMLRGGSHDETPESQITVIEALRKEISQEISGIQTALKKSELESIQDAVSQVALRASPSVVAVRSAEEFAPLRSVSSVGDYANRRPAAPAATSLVPGISGIVMEDGQHVLTSAGVESLGADLRVVFNNSTIVDASLVGVDPDQYIAVLKLRSAAPVQPAAPFDRTAQFQPGNWLIRMGRSSAGRESVSLCQMESLQLTAAGLAVGLLDSEAAPEIDGGGLLDVRGRVVGIYISPQGQRGFAIPIGRALYAAEILLARPAPARSSWVGMGFQELSDDLRRHFDVDHGALVARVRSDGPGAKAGIQPMDLVVKLRKENVPSAQWLADAIAGTAPGSRIGITIRRGARERDVVLATEPVPVEPAPAPDGDSRLSIAVSPAPGGQSGVTIETVGPRALANRTGLQRGDLIRSVNGTAIATRDQFSRLQRNPVDGRTQLWEIRRGDQVFFVAVAEPIDLQ